MVERQDNIKEVCDKFGIEKYTKNCNVIHLMNIFGNECTWFVKKRKFIPEDFI